MCGIFGLLGPGIDPSDAVLMRDRMRHRGPDDAGEWYDSDARVWLGHRRLSILDLTAAGHQPMHSSSGRYVIVFNGEVYNFVEIRSELRERGSAISGHSDTEVVLEAIETWGLEAALKRFIGMFAFGLWDRQTRSLMLVRDRIGKKPVYYAHAGERLAFASEMRALNGLEWIDHSIDPEAVAGVLRHICVPAPLSIVRGIHKLQAGEMLVWSNGAMTITRYWSVAEAARAGRATMFKRSFEETADEFETLLSDAVALRMRSDVPYGSFLSGGIDSSLISALMQRQSAKPIKTFSIGFRNSSNDESAYARAVAAHLGTDHHEQIIDGDSVPDIVDDVLSLHDEPFADGSSIPTYMLCKFAREHVTVAMGGDGGDETHGGYPRYFWAARLERWRSRLGKGGSRIAAGALRSLPAPMLDGPVNALSRGRFGGAGGLAARVYRFADYLDTDPRAVDQKLNSAWPDPADVMAVSTRDQAGRNEPWSDFEWADQMMAMDEQHYLPDDILTKVDRMSMAVSMEVRAPLLDHRLIEWAWRVPNEHKLSAGGDKGKLLMRHVLRRHVPDSLIERPKQGFGMPMDHWLRGPLRGWADSLLTNRAIEDAGLLRSDVVAHIWQEHLAGENRLARLWPVLVLQHWMLHIRNRTLTVGT